MSSIALAASFKTRKSDPGSIKCYFATRYFKISSFTRILCSNVWDYSLLELLELLLPGGDKLFFYLLIDLFLLVYYDMLIILTFPCSPDTKETDGSVSLFYLEETLIYEALGIIKSLVIVYAVSVFCFLIE